MRRRPGRLGMAVVAVVLLAASGCGVVDGGSRPGAAKSWRQLAAAPLSPRVGHAAVWTGSEMLVWGGARPARGGRSEVAMADGAAYRPASRTWRPIPLAPLAGDTAVWAGTELLVFLTSMGTGSPGCSRW